MRSSTGEPSTNGDPLSLFVNDYGNPVPDIKRFSQNCDNIIIHSPNIEDIPEEPFVLRPPYEPYYHAFNKSYERPSNVPSVPFSPNIHEQNTPIDIEESSEDESSDKYDFDIFKFASKQIQKIQYSIQSQECLEIMQEKRQIINSIENQTEIYIENQPIEIQFTPKPVIEHSHFSTQVFDLEPKPIEEQYYEEEEIQDDIRFNEGHLTSTSDLNLDAVQIRPKTKSSTPKSHSSDHKKPRVPGLLPPPMTIQEMHTPNTLQGVRRVGGIYSNATLKKNPGRNQMTDDFIRNMLSQQKQEKEQQQQKPMTNCCVAAAMGNSFRPLYTEFGTKEPPKIHWMSFPGLNISPFETPPTNTEEYLLKQKKKQEAQPNAVENEAIAINYCEICKTRFTDAAAHRASENHMKCARGCNWKDLDDLFKDINEKFVRELDQ